MMYFDDYKQPLDCTHRTSSQFQKPVESKATLPCKLFNCLSDQVIRSERQELSVLVRDFATPRVCRKTPNQNRRIVTGNRVKGKAPYQTEAKKVDGMTT